MKPYDVAFPVHSLTCDFLPLIFKQLSDLWKVKTHREAFEHAKRVGKNKSLTDMKFWVQIPAPQRGEESERSSERRVGEAESLLGELGGNRM